MRNKPIYNPEIAVFGGGCFWCTEAIFKMLQGVTEVKPGYAGGSKSMPTYEEVSTGNTGHAEVISLKYQPDETSYRDLLTVFFATHDPYSLNRQGNDIGTQYRSVIFYTTEQQKNEATKFIAKLNDASEIKIVTEIKPLIKFYQAENYHDNYYANHKNALYCTIVINPKLQKVKDKFSLFLRKQALL